MFDRTAVEPELYPLRLKYMDTVSVAARSLLIYVCLLFLFSGCAREVPTFEPADMPASSVVEQLEEAKEKLHSFRAVGSIQIKGEKQRWSGRVFLLAQLPSSLRLEVLNFFGQPVMYAASNGYEFLIWQPGHGQAYEGLATQGTLTRLIKFPLVDEEAVLLLAGIVPTWEQAEGKLFKLPDKEGMLLQLVDTPSRLMQRVWLEGERRFVTKIERFRGGKLAFEARFSDFVTIDGWFYPRSIMLEGAKTRLTIRYEQIATNERLDQSVFHLTLPEGVETIPW